MSKYFNSIHDLKIYVQQIDKGSIPIGYQLLPNYEGMAFFKGIVFDVKKAIFQLNLEWVSLGLDLYGDTYQEGYVYTFENLEKLIEYLESNYQLKITEIPLKYEFETNDFPNPIKNALEKPIYEKAWERFIHDFENKVFLDTSIHKEN